jgi:hypothetical protein
MRTAQRSLAMEPFSSDPCEGVRTDRVRHVVASTETVGVDHGTRRNISAEYMLARSPIILVPLLTLV